MAKFDIDTSGFDELLESLENAERNCSDIDGDLTIHGTLRSNLSEFNSAFSSPITINSSDDEIIEYFNSEYLKMVQELLLSNVSAKDAFNKKFTGYASIS